MHKQFNQCFLNCQPEFFNAGKNNSAFYFPSNYNLQAALFQQIKTAFVAALKNFVNFPKINLRI